MTILVDSTEYRAWHEVGHATVCLDCGGTVEFIELLENDPRGHAFTRCIVLPEFDKTVACGGFAAEFYLLKNRLAEQAEGDERNINHVVFHNATVDREDFWDRRLKPGEYFSEQEDEAFMNHAVEVVAPIFDRYFPDMQQLVRELCAVRKVDGKRIRELLRPAPKF